MVDDKASTCSSINMDHRSLYHHFENGCLYMKCQAMLDTKAIFEQILLKATENSYTGRNQCLRFKPLLMRLTAPLLKHKEMICTCGIGKTRGISNSA